MVVLVWMVVSMWTVRDSGAGGVGSGCSVVGVDCGRGVGGVDSGCGAGGVDGGCGKEDEERSVEQLQDTRVESPHGESPLDSTVHSDVTAEIPQTQQLSPQTTAVRRSTRHRQVPDYYALERTYLATGHMLEPKTLEQVLTSAEKHHWVKTME